MKIWYKTVGCRVNQVETESLRERFASLGHAEAASPEEADLVIVNTCSVTARADRDSLAFLRRAAAANPRAAVIATGCLATLSPEKIIAAAPAAALYPNADKEKIFARVCGAAAEEGFFPVKASRGRARAFVKVQEGCNLKCAYCLVNLARPKVESKPLRRAVEEVRRLAEAGYAEVVLCGTHLGIYRCPETGAGLDGLCGGIFSLPGNFRLRLSSLEPGELPAALLRTLKAAGRRFCDYFHLPLQAGSDGVLRAMGRLYTTGEYRAKVDELRSLFPGAGVYADIIAGFPSETRGDHEASLRFVRECGLSGLHVFSFSGRRGTPAALLPPLPSGEVAARSCVLRGLDGVLRAAFAASRVGTEAEALVLRNKAGRAQGLAGNFLELEFPGQLKPGTLAAARIVSARGGRCGAETLP